MAGLATLGGAAEAAGAGGAEKDYLELRLYHADAGPMRERLDTFLRDAAIPAWNRIGIANVGVFGLMEEPKEPPKAPRPDDPQGADLFVLLAHKSIASFATAAQRLWADAEYQKAGAALLDPPKANPTYKRIESSLMLAFDQCPHLDPPKEKKDSRVFQLRIYESHSDAKAIKKIEMFNTGGEIALFRRTGVNPVFFGQTLAGGKLPNLTYMVTFDDMAAQKAAWDRFMKSPEWVELKAKPEYADTVSNITNILLRPTAYSQL
jgi:hypothetical protein